MDLIRNISDRSQFAPYSYEYTFPVPSTDRKTFQDLLISLHGSPNTNSPGAQTGVSCNDVHVYVDGIDITDFFIADLKANLDKRGADAKKEYGNALSKWIELEQKMGAAYGTPDIDKEKQMVKTLLDNAQISKCLDQLGNTTVGWGGNLHLFNFLYKDIPIEPVSLIQLIARYNKTATTKIDATKIERIVFSSGVCRLYDSNWDPKNLATGTLNCLFEIRVHNLLEDRVARLETNMENLQATITESLRNIQDYLAGDVNESLREVKSISARTNSNIGAVQAEFKNHVSQLSSLKDSTNELHKAIESL